MGTGSNEGAGKGSWSN